MINIQCDFKSEALGMYTQINVILPEMKFENKNEKCKVIYLLHGLSDDNTGWCRRTSVERYAQKYNVAVVMPNGAKSFYFNTKNDTHYFDFIAKELKEFCENYFPISNKKEDCFIAGLSMGGYGALKIGLNNSDKYKAIGSFSGVVNIITPDLIGCVENVVLDPMSLIGTNHDIFHLVKNVENPPNLFIACGKQDFLYEDNLNLKNALQANNIDFKWVTGEGDHNWDYWDAKINEFMQWAL